MKKLLLIILGLSFCLTSFAYKPTAISVEGETLRVTVTYVYDGKTLTVSIPIFQPKTEEETTQAIKNRIISEKRKLDAEATNKSLKVEIDKKLNQEVPE